jgi:hypothetical protein
MITRATDEFFALARALDTDFGPACANAVFMVSPVGFSLAEQSALDNRYMQMHQVADAELAMAEHQTLQLAIQPYCPVICFAGDARMPDAVFPNNVFATTAGKSIIGHMRHPVRQREALRMDIRQFFTNVLSYQEIDLSHQAGICELTGSMVIDRARGLGFCGLSERCDAEGAAAMHKAFGLRATLLFDLADGEYHSNVVLSILASRALIIAPSGFANSKVANAIADFYRPAVIELCALQKAEFAANCISLNQHVVFMSERAERSLHASQLALLNATEFSIVSVAMPTLEMAGGSLRCCVGEIF